MTEFKIGDIITLVNKDGENTDISYGTKFTVTRCSDWGVEFLDEVNYSRRRPTGEFILVKPHKEVVIEKVEKTKGWGF